MSRFRSIAIACLLPCAFGASAEEHLIIEEPRSAPSQTTSKFHGGEGPDNHVVSVQWETSDGRSRVRRLAVNDIAYPAGDLDLLNQSIGDDTIAEVTAGCSRTGIQVVVTAFRPGQVKQGDCLTDALDFLPVRFDLQKQQFTDE